MTQTDYFRRMNRGFRSSFAAQTDWRRFGVADPQGRWAETWKLWTKRHGAAPSFCVGNRFLHGYYQFEQARRGEWRVWFVSQAEQTAQSLPVGSSVSVSLHCLHDADVTCSLALRIANSPESLVFPNITGRYRYIEPIPGHPRRVTETSILIVEGEGRGSVLPASALAGYVVLTTMGLGNGNRVVVVYRLIDTADATAIPVETTESAVLSRIDHLPERASCLKDLPGVTLVADESCAETQRLCRAQPSVDLSSSPSLSAPSRTVGNWRDFGNDSAQASAVRPWYGLVRPTQPHNSDEWDCDGGAERPTG